MNRQSPVQAKKIPRIPGVFFGFIFGFLLQKGGVAKYEVIMGQLLLTDFTVVKIMCTAMVTGMIGVHLMKRMGWVEFSLKAGSMGRNIPGGLIFGVGFGLLGFCPGTIAAAAGSGYLDAAVAGLTGMILGCGAFAALYPKINEKFLKYKYFGELTLPELLKVNTALVVLMLSFMIVGMLIALECTGL